MPSAEKHGKTLRMCNLLVACAIMTSCAAPTEPAVGCWLDQVQRVQVDGVPVSLAFSAHYAACPAHSTAYAWQGSLYAVRWDSR